MGEGHDKAAWGLLFKKVAEMNIEDVDEPEDHSPPGDDICSCGHARDAHKDGAGTCRFIDVVDGTAGAEHTQHQEPCACDKFDRTILKSDANASWL